MDASTSPYATLDSEPFHMTKAVAAAAAALAVAIALAIEPAAALPSMSRLPRSSGQAARARALLRRYDGTARVICHSAKRARPSLTLQRAQTSSNFTRCPRRTTRTSSYAATRYAKAALYDMGTPDAQPRSPASARTFSRASSSRSSSRVQRCSTRPSRGTWTRMCAPATRSSYRAIARGIRYAVLVRYGRGRDGAGRPPPARCRPVPRGVHNASARGHAPQDRLAAQEELQAAPDRIQALQGP
ncbi:hypothetical protein PsYK624_166290 [Phanerochaete sordida]|uniref:Uncharacterized protein n=1 Tax=Phanerochaete sordida TaxID=48140 RepID=A0A9P3GSK7_9APHY|nr:hypothetical protein PsYK624_166290 [Phanerochaete sordida]